MKTINVQLLKMGCGVCSIMDGVCLIISVGYWSPRLHLACAKLLARYRGGSDIIVMNNEQLKQACTTFYRWWMISTKNLSAGFDQWYDTVYVKRDKNDRG